MSSWNGPWQLVELGPGSGALMVDILRVLNKLKANLNFKNKNNFSNFQSDSNLSVHFVENSQKLIGKQKKILEEKMLNKEIPLFWHNKIEDIPDGVNLLLLPNK